jgi:hypothetical protein
LVYFVVTSSAGLLRILTRERFGNVDGSSASSNATALAASSAAKRSSAGFSRHPFDATFSSTPANAVSERQNVSLGR